MGVKDLWAILDPIAENISLGDLNRKAVAIDLSAWVCDSQAVGQNHPSILRPDIRNTFFRASRLVLSDVRPIFILEGEAPELKHDTIRNRNQSQRTQNTQGCEKSKKPPRSQYLSRLKPMLRLLDAMGLPYLQSSGEAEKLCAYLNHKGIVAAVISQDSDCLLYGAKEVLRNFSVANGRATARRYSISEARKLGLDRERLIVLSLLLGCDYCPGGVPGVGREQASTYLAEVKGSPLERIRSWRSDPLLCQLEKERVQMSQPRICAECWHPGTAHKHSLKGCIICDSTTGCTVKSSVLKAGDAHSKWQLLELQIRNKAIQNPIFPSEEIISEFLKEEVVNWKDEHLSWKQPNAHQLLDICTKVLGWERSDAVEKVLQLISRWQCQQFLTAVPGSSLPLHPASLLKLRVQHGIKCIEVQWTPGASFPLQIDEVAATTTLEPLSLFTQAYPLLYQQFEHNKQASKKKSKKEAETKSKKVHKSCATCGFDSVKEGHICQYLAKKTEHSTPSLNLLDEMMAELELEETVPEHELSDIVSSIVNRVPTFQQSNQITAQSIENSLQRNLDLCDNDLEMSFDPLPHVSNHTRNQSPKNLVTSRNDGMFKMHKYCKSSVPDESKRIFSDVEEPVDAKENCMTKTNVLSFQHSSTPHKIDSSKTCQLIHPYTFNLGLSSLLDFDVSFTE